MGGLSRKRLKARVVKKSRNQKQKKGLNVAQLPPGLKKHWEPELTIRENYAKLGL